MLTHRPKHASTSWRHTGTAATPDTICGNDPKPSSPAGCATGSDHDISTGSDGAMSDDPKQSSPGTSTSAAESTADIGSGSSCGTAKHQDDVGLSDLLCPALSPCSPEMQWDFSSRVVAAHHEPATGSGIVWLTLRNCVVVSA